MVRVSRDPHIIVVCVLNGCKTSNNFTNSHNTKGSSHTVHSLHGTRHSSTCLQLVTTRSTHACGCATSSERTSGCLKSSSRRVACDANEKRRRQDNKRRNLGAFSFFFHLASASEFVYLAKRAPLTKPGARIAFTAFTCLLRLRQRPIVIWERYRHYVTLTVTSSCQLYASQ